MPEEDLSAELKNSYDRILILGGAGLVGRAVCREILKQLQPAELIVHSLLKTEVEEAIRELEEFLREEYLDKFPVTKLIPEFGNMFVPFELKDKRRNEILGSPEWRKAIIQSVLDDLSKVDLDNISLYRVLTEHKPSVVIDCINTATAISYQNIYAATDELRGMLNKNISMPSETNEYVETLKELVEKLFCSLEIPQLVRHYQILVKGLEEAETKIYLKVGTTGTGGMGITIPYTHGEDSPSRTLLSKSAVAGAHTQLLYLLYATPRPPITKEIKPSTSIAWKKIKYGLIHDRQTGEPIKLVDCDPSHAFTVGSTLDSAILNDPHITQVTNQKGHPADLQGVYLDAGENGLFSLGEFTALTAIGQMEFITPEEIANEIVYELRGSSTNSNILSAIRGASLGPTYRAGAMRNTAIETMKKYQQEYRDEGVAYEQLGPPRLTKLLFEAQILKEVYGTLGKVKKTKATDIESDAVAHIAKNRILRSRILTLGLPILLPGNKFLCGHKILVPKLNHNDPLSKKISIGPLDIGNWKEAGWVDLTSKNWESWEYYIGVMLEDCKRNYKDTSSYYSTVARHIGEDEVIDIGELAAWIFVYIEDKRRREFRN